MIRRIPVLSGLFVLPERLVGPRNGTWDADTTWTTGGTHAAHRMVRLRRNLAERRAENVMRRAVTVRMELNGWHSAPVCRDAVPVGTPRFRTPRLSPLWSGRYQLSRFAWSMGQGQDSAVRTSGPYRGFADRVSGRGGVIQARRKRTPLMAAKNQRCGHCDGVPLRRCAASGTALESTVSEPPGARVCRLRRAV